MSLNRRLIKNFLLFLALLSGWAGSAHAVPDGAGNEIFIGNVGIGSFSPVQKLDIQGSVRAFNFIGSGAGLTGAIGGWTLAGANLYTTVGTDNVGIGTVSPANSQGLSVLGGASIGSYAAISAPAGGLIASGNVGVGTAFPSTAFQVGVNALSVNTANGNVGIGTVTPANTQGLSVLGGVSIGSQATTTAPAGGLLVSGNVGVAGVFPSAAFQVGTNGFIVNTTNGNVGIGTVSPANLQGLSVLGGVSLGTYATTSAPPGGLLISGNVGVGVFPSAALQVGVNALLVNSSSGNVGIGTLAPNGVLDVEGTLSPVIFNATSGAKAYNVGVGSFAPGQKLDVTGTIRAVGLTMSGQTPKSGYVLTASDTAGDTAWTSPSNISAGGWTVTGANVYTTNISGNVGIGTTIVNQAALTVMNGNVGIGSWAAGALLDIRGTAQHFYIDSSANLGVGTTLPVGTLDVEGGTSGSGSGAPITLIAQNAYGGAGKFFGGAVTITAGNSAVTTGAALGGGVNITAGNGAYVSGATGHGNGGTVSVLGGNGGAESAGGSVYFDGGAGGSTSGNGGTAVIAGGGATNGTGGQVQISGGQTSEGVGGQTSIYGGSSGTQGSTPWPGGAVAIQGGSGVFGGGGGAVTISGGQDSNTFSWGAVQIQLNGGNVGIGTSTPAGGLVVTNGNVGIGTWVPGASLIVQGGNVGIGTNFPGQTLDVSGTVRALYFMGNGSLLTGITGTNYWNYSASGNIGVSTIHAVGIGTSFIGGANEAALSVMNGNVGIGTWLPAGALDVEGSMSTAIFAGNVGIGTNATTFGLTVAPNMSVINTTGNALINFGSFASGANEVLRFVDNSSGGVILLNILSINAGNANNALNNIPSSSDIATQASATGGLTIDNVASAPIRFAVGGTAFTNEVMRIDSTGNVGIGSVNPVGQLNVEGTQNVIFFSQAASTGNVGIGTWAPGGELIVKGGNVGIGTNVPGQALDVNGTVRDLGEIVNGNIGIGTSFIGGSNEAALSVMKGNVGIGTWVPAKAFSVTGDSYNNGNIGVGTTLVGGAGGQGALSVMNGNVGIGTWVPGALLTVGANVFQVNNNGRINLRVISTSGAATTMTPTSDTADIYEFSTTAAAGTLTAAAPTGTPVDGQLLEIEVDTTNAQTWSWNAVYVAGNTVALPAATPAAVWQYIIFQYNNNTSKWVVQGVN